MKPVLCLGAVLLAAGVFSTRSLPPRTKQITSPTRSFCFLGNWYCAGKPSQGQSLIQQELSRHGADIDRIPPKTLESGDEIPDPLSRIPAKTPSRPDILPGRFRPENSLLMESGGGFIEISYGNMAAPSSSVRSQIASEGWTSVAMEGHRKPFFLATIQTERETSFVFLEEKEGNYLFIRRLKK